MKLTCPRYREHGPMQPELQTDGDEDLVCWVCGFRLVDAEARFAEMLQPVCQHHWMIGESGEAMCRKCARGRVFKTRL